MKKEELIKKFLFNRDETGRFIVKSWKTGKTYFVEPIDGDEKTVWGDYNPATKTVNLSEDVYNGANVAAAAVAAHECGHAVQHATAYGPLGMRSALVPVVSFSSKWVTWIILGGLLLLGTGAGRIMLLIGICLYAMITLFSFITLPVEVNASQRAVNWLQEAGITDRETTEMASDALHGAAYTYVVAALSALATLIYYILIFLGDRR